LCATLALAAAPAAAQPAIGAIINNYSATLPGLPNYGIAQGSIFQLWGTGMAGSVSAQNAPLQTTVAGTTINVTVAGVTTHPPLYYLSPTQINGILPSSTPVGTGTITVTYNNQTSPSFPIQVVQSAFGMLSLNQAGTGPSAVLDVNYHLLGFANAANPNDYLNFWGTGLGPISGDETVYPQTQTNLTNIPIEVDIGGVKATVTYHGRSQFPGLDQVQVQVPSGVSGCYVSVVVVSGSGNVVSNFGTIPVVTSGRTCSDQTSVLSASQLQTLSNQSTVSYGALLVGQTTTTTQPITVSGIIIQPGGTTVADSASALFVRYTGLEFQDAVQTIPSPGSCAVFTMSESSGVANPFLPTYLNAGAAVNVTSPQGKQALTPVTTGIYSNSALPTGFVPASGGAFSFDNGSGGSDVGPFTASLTAAAPLTWTNMNSITTVTRSQGVTVNWTGGAASSFVQIFGSAFSGSSSSAVGGYFYCTAPVSAGTFTVPASVLLSLPPTGSYSYGATTIPIPGSLSVSNYSNPKQFTATGLDFGYVTFFSTNTVEPAYQ
jgi:uncharacterized protein (TIGR03437 family)